MNKLKRKMFLTLFFVLSLLVGVGITLFCGIDYVKTVSHIQSELAEASSSMEDFYSNYKQALGRNIDWDEFVAWADGNFYQSMADPTYTALIGEGGSIDRLLVRSNPDKNRYNEVLELVHDIVENEVPGKMQIPNPLTSKFAWYYANNRNITIIDIQAYRGEITNTWGAAGLLACLSMGVVYCLSSVLTKWMLNPVLKSFERQRQFVADASHELKTPIAVIMASAENMEKDMDSKWLRNIQDETTRMNKLVTALLDLTKTEEVELQKQTVDLSFLIEKDLLTHEAVIFEKGLNLKDDIDPGLYSDVQEDMITQVFVILLDNAINHAAKNIEVSLHRKGSDILLEIANDGAPIPKEEQDKIFERFYRSDSARTRSSNRYGLGLAIAKNIAHLHEGALSVRSDVQKTVFTFTLKESASKGRKTPESISSSGQVTEE